MTAPPIHVEDRELPFRLCAHPDLGVEMLQATVRRHSFDPHFHEAYLIGLTRGGVEEFSQNGRVGRSTAGQIRIVEPGVVHSGAPADGSSWSYVALYVAPSAFDGLVAEGSRALLLNKPVLTDPELFRAGMSFTETLAGSADPLEREERLAQLLLRLVRHHRHDIREEVRPEPEKIRLARQYIRHRMATVVRLDELAAAVGFSKFHLLRTFKATTGLTPWRYQVQLRLSVARDLLRTGTSASQVAVICGFFDQSHFTRLFRASFGITPAAFAAAYRGQQEAPR